MTSGILNYQNSKSSKGFCGPSPWNPTPPHALQSSFRKKIQKKSFITSASNTVLKKLNQLEYKNTDNNILLKEQDCLTYLFDKSSLILQLS